MAVWIKLRKKLRSDARVIALAAKLNKSKAEVIGGLALLWMIADEQGDALPGVTPVTLSNEVGVPGLCEALPPDWLQATPEGVVFPNYREHNGTTTLIREQTAARVAKHRERQRHGIVATPNDDALQANAPVTEKKALDKSKKLKTNTSEPKPKAPPPEWAYDLAVEIGRHVVLEFGQNTGDNQLVSWARRLDSLTRSNQFSPKPTPQDVKAVIAWGLTDREERGNWRGWSRQIRSAPDADKFAKIRAAMRDAQRTPSAADRTW